MSSTIDRALRRFRLKSARAESVYGLAVTAAVVGLWVLLGLAMNIAFDAPTWARFAFAAVGLAAVGWAFGESVVAPFARRRKARVLASQYERLRDLGGALRTAVDFRDGRVFSRGHSEELLRESMQLAEQKVGSPPPVPIPRSAVAAVRIAFIAASGVLLAAAVDPPTASQALGRAVDPLREIESSSPSMVVLPGDTRVVSHENLMVTAHVSGTDQVPEVVWRYPAGDFSRATMTRAEDHFEATITDLRMDVLYRVEVEDAESPLYTVDVIDLPRVVSLRVRVVPPGYTRLDPIDQPPGEGDAAGIVGSRVEVRVASTRVLSAAFLEFDDSSEVKLAVGDRVAEGRFALMRDGTYTIRLVDAEGQSSADPIVYRLTATEDMAPEVELVFPPTDVSLDESLKLPIAARMRDDFGFSRVALLVSVNDGPLDTVDLSGAEELGPEAEAQTVLDLEPLSLLPEDVVTLRVAVWDNDRVGGPKAAESRAVRARFPSLDEIMAEVEGEQSGARQVLEGAREQARRVREALEQLRRELAGESDVQWEEGQEASRVLDEQRQIARQIERATSDIAAAMERLESNELASSDLAAKFEKMQSLMRQIATPELKAAMDRLQKALESLDPEAVRRAAEELNLQTEELIRRLDRSIALLEQLAVEQKLDALVETADRLVEEQREQNAAARESASDLDSLAEREELLSQELETLEREMSDARETLSEHPQGDPQTLDEAGESAEQAGEQMAGMTQSLKSGERQSARERGRKAQAELERMRESLDASRRSFNSAVKQDVLAAMGAMMQELLYLSQEQEALRSETQNRDARSSELPALASEQSELGRAAERTANDLRDLAGRTMFLRDDVSTDLSRGLDAMARAVDRLTARDQRGAESAQGQALASVNAAARKVLEAARDASQSQSGSGMDSLLESLKRMAGQQEGVNQGTGELPFGMNPGSMSQSISDELARLSAEQQALAQRMSRLGEQHGGRSDVPGDLAALADEMERAAEELRREGASRDVLDRQERILSRMLDYEKSLREREQEETRRAERPGDFSRRTPPPLAPVRRETRARPDLERVLKEGVPREYEARVRAYFEALSRSGVR